MAVDLVSLALIALVAVICPLIAKSIPGRPIPETVFLIIAGALLGPFGAHVILLSESVDFLSELGLSFLFLLAGYEIDPKILTGHQGKRGLVTWIVTFALGFGIAMAIPFESVEYLEKIAIAIVLGTTALGTLIPILAERGLVGTSVGNAIVSYGTWGELGPVLAMALLLSTRAKLETALILLAFTAFALLIALFSARIKKIGHALWRFLEDNADTNSQTMVRATFLLLIALVAFSAVFDLDIVLGAFAAGFVLRFVIPEGNSTLERKLEGIAYGFLIPIFFVVSGARIDIASVGAQPFMLVGFVILLLLVRAVPIYLSLWLDRKTKDMTAYHRITVALYCTTALPLIVAVTSVAVEAGAMLQETASVMVAAGAVTVFLMPLLTSITYRIANAQPLAVAKEIGRNPHDARDIMRIHAETARLLSNKAISRDVNEHASERKPSIEEIQQLLETRVSARASKLEERHRDILQKAAKRAAKEYARRLKDMASMAKSFGADDEDIRELIAESVERKPERIDNQPESSRHSDTRL